MKLVVIESPYAGDVLRNTIYLGRCVRDCLGRGESPYASHGFFTHFLSDAVPEERDLGIRAGLEWAKKADFAVFYTDYGMSTGMEAAYDFYIKCGKPIEARRIGLNP